jgi:hypothetical protein
MSSRSPTLRRNQREVFFRAKATAAGNITKDKTAKYPKKRETWLGVISIVDNIAAFLSIGLALA